MKLRTLFLATMAAATPFAMGQNTITFAPHFRQGDVDHYHMKMTSTGQMAMNISMEMTEKVVKIYPNGDADLTINVGSMTMNGKPNQMKLPGQTMRVNKYGQPVAGQAASMMGSAGFDPTSMGSMMPHRPLHAGEVIKIDQPGKNGTSVKGTMKVASISGGVATLVMDTNMSLPTGNGHMMMVAKIGCSDSKMRSMEGDITGMMGGANSKMHMSITRS